MNTVAIIGCGRKRERGASGKEGWAIAYAHADGYRGAFPQVALAAVDPNPDNLSAFGDHYGIPPARRFDSVDAMYAAMTPDAVSLCTWPALHVPQARQAIHRGVKAVVVEKPLGVDGFEIHELLDQARRGKSRVAVAHQRRYEPHFVRAREIVRSGALGQNLLIEARVGDDWDMLSWTVHWFDMANFLFDATPASVLAGIDHRGGRRYGHAVEHASLVLAEYDEHRQGIFITGPKVIPGAGFSVRGERGLLEVGNPLKLWTTEGYREIASEPAAFSDAFASLFADLWRSVETGQPCQCDLSLCAAATQTALAAQESARTCRRVPLPLQAWYAPLEVLQHPAGEERMPPLSVAVLADGHHEWHGVSMSGRDGLAEALTELGHCVTLLDASKDLPTDVLDAADVLVIYHTQQTTRASHRDVVGRWFSSRKPVLVSHCGIGAYADWPEYRNWIGRYWVWGGESLPPSRHPHVPVTLRVCDPGFRVPWSDAWLPTDEMYQQLGQAGEVRDLVMAVAPDGATQAFAWQVADCPNVVAWLPGHRRDMFSLPVVRDGLAASLRLIVPTR